MDNQQLFNIVVSVAGFLAIYVFNSMTAKIQKLEDNGMEGIDAESRMRLRSIDVQMLRVLEEVSSGRQESLSEIRSDLANLTKAIRALSNPASRDQS